MTGPVAPLTTAPVGLHTAVREEPVMTVLAAMNTRGPVEMPMMAQAAHATVAQEDLHMTVRVGLHIRDPVALVMLVQVDLATRAPVARGKTAQLSAGNHPRMRVAA